MSDEIVKHFQGFKPNPTIREVAARQEEDVDIPDPAENAFVACLPGDADHPLDDPNPWLSKLPSTIQVALATGLSEEEERKARRALAVHERLEGAQYPESGSQIPPVAKRTFGIRKADV